MRSNFTVELREAIAAGYNLFDFDYTRDAASQEIVSNEELQQGFIGRYFFREIGQETVERFKHYFKTQWLESIGNFDKLLVAERQPIDWKSNAEVRGNNLSITNNTPKSAIDLDVQLTHASSITKIDNSNKGYGGITEPELLKSYRDNIIDVTSEFYDSFDNLFMQIL